jgi:hypothetical protein
VRDELLRGERMLLQRRRVPDEALQRHRLSFGLGRRVLFRLPRPLRSK